MRKTVKVSELKNQVNEMLRQDICSEGKGALTVLIEDVLMRTQNYRGFKWNMTTEEAREIKSFDARYFDRTYF